MPHSTRSITITAARSGGPSDQMLENSLPDSANITAQGMTLIGSIDGSPTNMSAGAKLGHSAPRERRSAAE
jgi:hypothetical protein